MSKASIARSLDNPAVNASWEIEVKDRRGDAQAVHIRIDEGDGKRCLWRLPGGTLKEGLKGRRTDSLPLYGIHELHPEAMLAVVTEGEKARDALEEALREAGITREQVGVVGTVTGASGTPSEEVLEDLRGHEVVLWPDTDPPGIEHMNRLAERLRGIASVVRVFEWHDAPVVIVYGKPKGQDAADHVAVKSGDEKALGRLLNDLCGAPRYLLAEGDKPRNVARRTISAAELMAKELPPTRWAVPDLVPEGVSLLAGKPKLGKSWLALGLCVATATGGYALGNKKVEQGAALYLALEDNERRTQKRLRKVLQGSPAPEGLHVSFDWPRLNEGGVEELRAWLNEHQDARLVVIDTLAKIRPPARGQNVYAEDYAALEKLLPLAAEYGVAVVVIHHLRKMDADDPLDAISGSTGLSGGVDGVLVLKRERGRHDATLYVDGRDIEEAAELALTWDGELAAWALAGSADEYRMSQERAAILGALRELGRSSTREISDHLESNYENVRKLLAKMAAEGVVEAEQKGRTNYYRAGPNDPNDPGDPNDPNDPNRAGRRLRPPIGTASAGDDPNSPPPEEPANGRETEPVGTIGIIGTGNNRVPNSPQPPHEDEHDRVALEALRRGNGPRKALEHYETNGTPFEQVVRSVMHYLGRGHDSFDDWEASVIRAIKTLNMAGAR
ncbi:MAG: AAA family ATPase [Actinomycetota bacterium]|nr:AAA family ATPase [Actinomycetota bacterium]